MNPREMTTGEAEAFRRGWEAAREAAAKVAEAEEWRLARAEERDAEWSACTIKDAIRAMEPPA
jgi:hypothetical protein